MSIFSTEPIKGSLAETYFTDKKYCYTWTDSYSLPPEMTIGRIVWYLSCSTLKAQSPFGFLITYIRLLKNLKKTTQLEFEECWIVKIGSEPGYMRIIDLTATEVLLLENYASPGFIVSFLMDKTGDNEYQIVISMNVLVRGKLNKLLFCLLKPIQEILAHYVLGVHSKS